MRSKGHVRIAIADSQPIFRLGVQTLLAQQPGLGVAGEAGTTGAAIELVDRTRPDVLLIDHNPPRIDALEVLRHLKAMRSSTRAIIVTGSMTEPEIQSALLQGTWGVVFKSSASTILPDCIRQVMKGEQWIGLESVNPLISGLRQAGTAGASSLTPREVDIVRRVARGASNKDIAAHLDMGEQTVKNHLRRIFRKLQVANRVELALMAIEHEAALPDDTSKTT
jgi:two-component system nitrate/nitrite response regulator NarL